MRKLMKLLNLLSLRLMENNAISSVQLYSYFCDSLELSRVFTYILVPNFTEQMSSSVLFASFLSTSKNRFSQTVCCFPLLYYPYGVAAQQLINVIATSRWGGKDSGCPDLVSRNCSGSVYLK
jgi:hypothetical protein